MHRLYYCLIDGKIVETTDLIQWGKWLDGAFKLGLNRIAFDAVTDDLYVSTVFLGLDRGFDGPPVLFETMVFARSSEGECIDEIIQRYCTLEEARIGHEKIVAKLRKLHGQSIENARKKIHEVRATINGEK